MRARVPWSELAALAAAWVALVAWNTARRPIDIEGALVALLAVSCALLPRRAHKGPHAASIEATRVVGALSAVAAACTVAGPRPPTPTLQLVHALTVAEALGLSAGFAFASPLRLSTLRRALVPGVIVALAAAVGLWPRVVDPFPGARALSAVAGWVTALLYVHGVQRPDPPLERARLVPPGLGAGLLAAALSVHALIPSRVSPLLLAGGLVAQVAGLTMGVGGGSLADAGPLARRAAAAVVALCVAMLTWALLPALPFAAPLAGLVAMVLLAPAIDARLRPDEGRLLAACDEIERAIPRAETLSDLATAVLDPLRSAARDLRAPAALWVLDRPRVFRVDVAGTASVNALALTSAKPLLAWLRARPTPVFIDALTPHLVRHPDLRAVSGCLDAHEAFGAVPLREEGELVGVLLLARGMRRDPPSFEEEARLTEVAKVVEGAVSRLAALERAQLRVAAAQDQSALDREARERAETALLRLREQVDARRPTTPLGGADLSWFAYSRPMRALDEAIARVGAERGAVAAVAEPGCPTAAAAWRVHCARGAARAFVRVDAARYASDDAMAALLGDARGVNEPGWLELADGGTLLIENLPALGHDALVALATALDEGRARRVGGAAAWSLDVDLIATMPAAPDAMDLPASLIARFGDRVLSVPPLRERREDLESLALASIDRACRALGRSVVCLSPEALAAVVSYPWPGNLPELDDAVARAVRRTRGSRVALDALPPQVRATVMPDDDESDDRWTRRHDDA
ncbi:MAG: sigma 54-interacting transcriptional regulator [Polyangiales bacterium]